MSLRSTSPPSGSRIFGCGTGENFGLDQFAHQPTSNLHPINLPAEACDQHGAWLLSETTSTYHEGWVKPPPVLVRWSSATEAALSAFEEGHEA
jgi:hypothetical protein